MDMRLRVQTVFKVSDSLDLTTRFDALDGQEWGATTTSEEPTFDRAYITWKTDLGMLQVGRMTGGTFGHAVFESEADSDRIKYILSSGSMTLIALYQKIAETDKGVTKADEDMDELAFAGVYKSEMLTAGLLYVWIGDKTGSSGAGAYDLTKHVLNPYFTANLGPVTLNGEVRYNFGQKDYDAAATTDEDINQLGAWIEASFNVGPARIFGSYLYESGDNDPNDDELNAMNIGGEWEGGGWILTNDTMNGNTAMGNGGQSNLSWTDYGANLFYVGADFSPMEDLSLGMMYSYATVAEAPNGWEDDMGSEIDFNFSYKLTDGLTYSGIIAYLIAGDFWQAGDTTYEVGNTWAFYHKLQIDF
jgi:hypothetical protein